MTRTQQFIHQSDTLFQFFAIFVASLMGVSAFFTNGATAVIFFILLFLIGIWQMGSALVRMLVFRNFTTFTYFFSALVYILFISIFLPLLVKYDFNSSTFAIAIWFMGVVPYAGAVWFLRHCGGMISEDAETTEADKNFVPAQLPKVNFLRGDEKIRIRPRAFRHF